MGASSASSSVRASRRPTRKTGRPATAAASKKHAESAPPAAPRVLPPPLVDTLASDFIDEPTLAGHPRLVVGTAGDHAAIFPFLTDVFGGPSHDAYISSLDDPFYEPRDRILVRRRHTILSHVRLMRRTLRLGAQAFPVTLLDQLGTVSSYQRLGYAHRLLNTAEAWMREDGAVLGFLKTSIPHFFRPNNWAVCGRHCYSRVRTRELLAQIDATSRGDLLHTERTYTIRPWRQIELGSVMQVYRRRMGSAFGAYERTEPYWRWLISRKAFEQLYVAIDGPDHFELESVTSPIVGYAIARGDQVLELMVDPEHPEAATQLLARACGEAIERDDHAVTYHGAPDDPLHGLARAAGASYWRHESHQGEVWMAKVFDPVALLRSLLPDMAARAVDLPRPCELGLVVEGLRLRVVATRRSVKLYDDTPGRSYISCNLAEFTRLLLGHTDVAEAVEQGRIEPSTRAAQEIARALFTPVPWWQPPFDHAEP